MWGLKRKREKEKMLKIVNMFINNRVGRDEMVKMLLLEGEDEKFAVKCGKLYDKLKLKVLKGGAKK